MTLGSRMEQTQLFDVPDAHRCTHLPAIGDGLTRARCICGADFTGPDSDLVAEQYDRHVEASRRWGSP